MLASMKSAMACIAGVGIFRAARRRARLRRTPVLESHEATSGLLSTISADFGSPSVEGPVDPKATATHSDLLGFLQPSPMCAEAAARLPSGQDLGADTAMHTSPIVVLWRATAENNLEQTDWPNLV